MNDFILEMKNITKRFSGVPALKNVNFSIKRGEIHCLVGENGAGKSTLMNILSGIYRYGTYEGDIVYDGKVQRFRSVKASENAGIAIISQELALIPELTVYENILFGHEITKFGGLVVDREKSIAEAQRMLDTVRANVSPTTLVRDLRIGHRQLIEIAKALSKKARLLILDEPTAALNEDDSKNLLRLLREFKENGVTVIMISHRLKEVIDIADSITVLRDGTTVCSLDASDHKITEAELVKYMVGREIKDIYPKREKKSLEQTALEIKNWSMNHPDGVRPVLEDINMYVRHGEVVGVAGLVGAGRTELALSIFGNTPGYKHVSGEVLLDGKRLSLRSPRDAMDVGLAYVSEDRRNKGLIMMHDVTFNTTIGNLKALLHHGMIDGNYEIEQVYKYKEAFNIKAKSIAHPVANLSGGNQQKVQLAKWLFTDPKVLILDEPTRGVDVGAKHEIYTIINGLVERGYAVILISSDLPEVLGMSDRIYVMFEGTVAGEMPAELATEQNIMALATNTKEYANE